MSSTPALSLAAPVRTRLLALAALALSACATRLAESPPAGVSLAGTWQLDPAHSSDANKILQELSRPRRTSSATGADGSYQHRSRQGQGGNDVPGAAFPGDPGIGGAQQPYRPPVDIQAAELRGGAWLQIEQRPDEMIINNGESTRSFTPGVKSVVSVSSGVADQVSGWKGGEYYVMIRPQVGPSITEHYRLSADRKQLTETISIGSEGRVPAVTLTRIYLPAEHLPSVVPGD